MRHHAALSTNRQCPHGLLLPARLRQRLPGEMAQAWHCSGCLGQAGTCFGLTSLSENLRRGFGRQPEPPALGALTNYQGKTRFPMCSGIGCMGQGASAALGLSSSDEDSISSSQVHNLHLDLWLQGCRVARHGTTKACDVQNTSSPSRTSRPCSASASVSTSLCKRRTVSGPSKPMFQTAPSISKLDVHWGLWVYLLLGT